MPISVVMSVSTVRFSLFSIASWEAKSWQREFIEGYKEEIIIGYGSCENWDHSLQMDCD